MQEIAQVYVTVLPSTKGLGKTIEGDIDKGVSGGTKKGDATFISTIGRWAGRATLAGAAIAGAFTIKGGISRLMAIDDAEGKLKGLGYNTQQIAAIMDNALSAVKGTAFGLGDAATAAASAVAAGIKPGVQLTKYLTLIGDAATIGGTSFNEMGAIINKVTTQGKAGMENLNQLSERGIPIMQWLAKEYGVTGAELTKMVSQGKVDAKTFRKVIKDNIGGAALESGKTFRGALNNLLASLGRIGANIMGPIFDQLAPAMGNITGALSPIEDAAKAVGSALASALGWIINNKDSLGVFVGAILAVAAALKVWAVAQALLNAVMAANPITLIVLAIAALVAGVIYAYQNFEGFRNVVDAVFGFIKTVVGAVVSWFTETAMPYIKTGWAIAVAAFQTAWNAIQPILNVIKTVIGVVFDGIKTYFTIVFNIYKTIFTVAFTVIKTIVTTAFNVVRTVVNTVMTVVSNIIKAQIAIWRTAFNIVRTVITNVVGFFQNLVNGVREKISAVTGAIGKVNSRIASVFSNAGQWLLNAGKQIIQGLIDGIRNMFDSVKNTLGELTSKLTDWKGPPAKDKVLLRGAGQMIMQGLIAGISDGESGLKSYLGRVTKAIDKALDLKQIGKNQAKAMKKLVDQTSKGLNNLANKIASQKEKLDAMLSDRAGLKSSVADSLTGEFDLGSLFNDNAGPLTFGSVMNLATTVANRLSTFIGKIKALVARGVPPILVQEIAGLGSEKGIAVANALLSGTDAQIGSLNSTFGNIQSTASAIGEAIAAQMFDTGIQAQKGLIQGLLDDKALKDAAKKLANGLTKAVRKELGIKSPSRRWRREIGRFLIPGAQLGVNDTLPGFRSHMADALDVADLVQPINVPAIDGAGSGGGVVTNYNATINAAPTVPTEKTLIRTWRDMENLYGMGA